MIPFDVVRRFEDVKVKATKMHLKLSMLRDVADKLPTLESTVNAWLQTPDEAIEVHRVLNNLLVCLDDVLRRETRELAAVNDWFMTALVDCWEASADCRHATPSWLRQQFEDPI